MFRSIAQQVQQRQRDKENGVKHTPLHTLQECCEAAGIDPRAFGRWANKYPDAPQPALQHGKAAWKAGKKYYRKHEFVQWVNQVRQQKEKAMPDIKSALQQALAKTATEWAADDEAHHKIEPKKEKTMTVTVSATAPTSTPEKKDGRIKSNVSRITFNFVRDNPGMHHDQVVERLSGQGLNANSVSALIYQMLRVRLFVADANGNLSAVVKDYVPIPSSLIRKKKSKAKAAPAPVAAGLASIAPVVTVDAPLPRKHIEIVNTRTGEVFNPRKEEWTVESVIGSLSVRQALAVYMELKQIFGE